MDECYGRSLGLNEIAGEAYFSPYHFLRLFRETFDLTPHQYLIQRRIAQAKHLLADRDFTVTDVCFEVGFESLGSFSSLFHRSVGVSPSQYRRRAFEFVQYSFQSPDILIPSCFLANFAIPVSVR